MFRQWKKSFKLYLIIATFVFIVMSMVFLTNEYDALVSKVKTVSHSLDNINNKEWIKQRMHIFNETGEKINADCVPLHHKDFDHETKICIYNASDDKYVSGALRKSGGWEEHMLNGLGTQFTSHPDALFLDIGSQVGTFTMFATAFGHKVIAIEPLKTSLELLSKSLHLAHQQDNVMLLWNAVSNVYEDVWLRYNKANIGSTHVVKKGGKGLSHSISAADYSVQTILLDDLVDIYKVKDKKLIMKIDIEGCEFLALIGGSRLFRENKVCFVSMELMLAKKSGLLHPIVEYMKSFGFELYDDPLLQTNITPHPERISGWDGYFSKDCN